MWGSQAPTSCPLAVLCSPRYPKVPRTYSVSRKGAGRVTDNSVGTELGGYVNQLANRGPSHKPVSQRKRG